MNKGLIAYSFFAEFKLAFKVLFFFYVDFLGFSRGKLTNTYFAYVAAIDSICVHFLLPVYLLFAQLEATQSFRLFRPLQ